MLFVIGYILFGLAVCPIFFLPLFQFFRGDFFPTNSIKKKNNFTKDPPKELKKIDTELSIRAREKINTDLLLVSPKKEPLPKRTVQEVSNWPMTLHRAKVIRYQESNRTHWFIPTEEEAKNILNYMTKCEEVYYWINNNSELVEVINYLGEKKSVNKKDKYYTIFIFRN